MFFSYTQYIFYYLLESLVILVTFEDEGHRVVFTMGIIIDGSSALVGFFVPCV